MSGEQFAGRSWSSARASLGRRRVSGELVTLSAADPLNLAGIVTGGERIPRWSRPRWSCSATAFRSRSRRASNPGESDESRIGAHRSLKLPFRPMDEGRSTLADWPFPAAVVYRRHALRVPVVRVGVNPVLTLLGLATSVVMMVWTTARDRDAGEQLAVKVLFFAITLPFRIVFAVLFFPFWIAKTVLKTAVGVVMVPLLLLVGVVLAVLAALAAIAAIVAPLLPLLIVGLLVWAVFRSFRPAAVAGGLYANHRARFSTEYARTFRGGERTPWKKIWVRSLCSLGLRG